MSQKNKYMAKPIKETPVLTGRDAKEFIVRMESADKNKISSEERAKMEKNFALLNAIAKF